MRPRDLRVSAEEEEKSSSFRLRERAIDSGDTKEEGEESLPAIRVLRSKKEDESAISTRIVSLVSRDRTRSFIFGASLNLFLRC